MRQKVNGKSFTLIALMIVALFVAAAFTFGITAPPTSSNNQQTITLTHPSQKVDQLTAMANTPTGNCNLRSFCRVSNRHGRPKLP